MTRRKKFSLDGILKSPWALWTISITLSVMMWVYVTGMDEAASITRKFSCALEYRGLDSQSILRGQLQEVDIEVSGTEEAMMRLDYDSVRAYVDARNLLPGKRYTVNINVEYPDTITLVSCFPSQTTLDIVRQVTRLMAVETILPQNIPEGHYVEGVEITPREVGVRGAEDDLVKIGSVRVTPTLEELQKGGGILMPVKFSQSEPFDGNVAIEPSHVRFRGSLVRGLPRKRVPVNARIAGKPDADYELLSVATDPSEVQIEGEAGLLAGIEAVDTEIIELSGMNTDSVIVSPLRQPDTEGVSLVSATSARVTINLTETRAEKMIRNIPVELRNSDKSRVWSSSPASVTVTVEARPSMIERFDTEKAGLRAYADLSNIFMTPVTIPVMTELVSSDIFTVVRVEPANVIVNSLAAE